MKTPVDLQAALFAAWENPSEKALTHVVAHLPDNVLASEWGRRRSKMRTNCAGPTGHWSKHNPNVNNCRCSECGKKREK